MEYVPGRTLAEVIAAKGPLPVAEVAMIGQQVAAALAAAHRLGITHRDIKPANILIHEDGTAKLADFGIARSEGDSALTSSGQVIGTVAYMAPEVASDSLDSPASDMWSLGATLFACTEGHAPFSPVGSNPSATSLVVRLISQPVPVPASAGVLRGVIMALLDRDAVRRPSPSRVRQSLAAIAGIYPLPERDVTDRWPSPSSPRDDDVHRPDTEGDTVVRSPAHNYVGFGPGRIEASASALKDLIADSLPEAHPAEGPAEPSTALRVRDAGPSGASPGAPAGDPDPGALQESPARIARMRKRRRRWTVLTAVAVLGAATAGVTSASVAASERAKRNAVPASLSQAEADLLRRIPVNLAARDTCKSLPEGEDEFTSASVRCSSGEGMDGNGDVLTPDYLQISIDRDSDLLAEDLERIFGPPEQLGADCSDPPSISTWFYQSNKPHVVGPAYCSRYSGSASFTWVYLDSRITISAVTGNGECGRVARLVAGIVRIRHSSHVEVEHDFS